MSIGGQASNSVSKNTSSSSSASNSFGFGQSGSFIDPNQQPFLDSLYNNASGVYDSVTPGIQALTGNVNQFRQQAADNLMGLGNTQQVIDSQLTGLRSGLDDIYGQGLNRIGDNAIGAGAFGGSRQGVTEAALGGEIGDAYTQGFGDIIANASRQSIDANNSAIAGVGQQVRDSLIGNYGGLEALSGILGNPTILSAAQDINFGQSNAQSLSRGQSSSESAGFGFDFK